MLGKPEIKRVLTGVWLTFRISRNIPPPTNRFNFAPCALCPCPSPAASSWPSRSGLWCLGLWAVLYCWAGLDEALCCTAGACAPSCVQQQPLQSRFSFDFLLASPLPLFVARWKEVVRNSQFNHLRFLLNDSNEDCWLLLLTKDYLCVHVTFKIKQGWLNCISFFFNKLIFFILLILTRPIFLTLIYLKGSAGHSSHILYTI